MGCLLTTAFSAHISRRDGFARGRSTRSRSSRSPDMPPDTESNVAGNDRLGAGVWFSSDGQHVRYARMCVRRWAASSRRRMLSPGRTWWSVLSYGYWRQRFGGNPAVIGENVRIDGISRRIIGVMPAGVRFPYADTQFLIPLAFKGGDPIDAWKDFGNRAFGRLKDGVTPAAAQAELRRLHSPMLKLFPWTMPDSWEADTTVVPLLESVVGDTRPRLLLLFGAVGLILLIACANVANLMLARATSREREMAIRGALGASGRRIIRQLLVESVLLGLLAGAVGLSLAAVSLRALDRLAYRQTRRALQILPCIGTCFSVCGGRVGADRVLFGLVPAIRMASPHLQEGLRSGSKSIAGQGIAVADLDAAGDGADRACRCW